MAQVARLFVLFIALFICGQNKLCSALSIEIFPNRIDSIAQSAVQISCIPSMSLSLEVKYTMMMQVLGVDGKPIAALTRGSDIPHGISNSSEFEIEGHIEDIIGDSYLRLTLLNPKEEDAGLYQCVIYYLDNSYLLKEKTAEANLTYDKPDVKSVLEFCNQKMSEFDAKLEEQTKHFESIETDLMNKISALETKQVNKSNTDYISAFSAKYTTRGSEAVGQTIVFNEIIMKEGEGYDEKSGFFTAPKTGIYGFNLAMIMSTKNAYIDLKMEVNDQTVAGLSAGSDNKYYDQSSISILLKLHAGDVIEVKVKSKSTTTAKLQTSEFTLFSGYLLREIR